MTAVTTTRRAHLVERCSSTTSGWACATAMPASAIRKLAGEPLQPSAGRVPRECEGALGRGYGLHGTGGRWASARRSWTEAAEAYHAAMDLTDRLFRTQLFRSHKEAWLREAKALPAHAAYALARSGDASGAVQALERGRALLLSESLQRDRANLDHLMDLGHQDLAESYRQAADRVHDLTRATRRPGPLDTDPVPSPDRNRS